MKKLILSAGMVLLLGAGASAQAKKKANAPKRAETPTVRLEQSSANAAKAPVGNARAFSISDPVVNFYNGRVSGSIPDEDVSRPVIGMPKLRYGVAHGRLLFYNTTGNSNGGNTGNGSVGTGTSLGSVGTSGVASGVNGKNPYAGPGIYGNRVRLSGSPVTLPPSPMRDRDRDDQRP
ncbi:MAG: hypothetical protein EOO16_11685 [Chitinophagaceae bacterium]|nr:MAG: hypothetical protein EOO16_11685 [Chitinophagaceae bacterium]